MKAPITSMTPSQQPARLPETVQTILVPTDFSDSANNAFSYALDMAGSLGAHIILAHIYQPEVESVPEDRLERYMNSIESYKKLAGSIDVRPILEVGEPSSALVELSKSLGPDLLIMGTQGAASHDTKPLGSVAATLIAKGACPVLAIPVEAAYQPISRLLYAMPLVDSDHVVIDFLIDLAKQLKARLTCVHINTANAGWDEVKLQEFKHEYVRDRETPISFIQAKDPDVLHGLQQIISQEKVDVLVMNTRDRTLLERFFDPSLTRAMLMYADLPVLALHV
jgi:nucleotide-binding universal stress UspA family protein